MNDIAILFAVAIVAMLLGSSIGSEFGEDTVKRQAFERGHMVQCVGKTGYYWECEE